MQVLILGFIPPEIKFLAIIFLASLKLKDDMSFWLSSNIPGTSVSNNNLLAFSLPAINPATVSAFIL